MHLTTFVSLLAVGAAAAPAAAPAKSWELNTTVAKPTVPLPTPDGVLDNVPGVSTLARRQEEGEETPVDSSSSSSSTSSSSSSEGLIPELPSLPIRRRQESAPTEAATAPEATKDPLAEYLATLDGEYDEKKSDSALNNYHDSLEDEDDEDESTVTTSTSTAAQTPAPETVNSTVFVETENATSTTTAATVPTDVDIEKLMAQAETQQNKTLTEPAATTNATLSEPTAATNETSSAIPEPTKNETSSAVPEPTKKAASSDPLAKLSGLLPIKRQELPELPEIPTLEKRQLDDLWKSVPDLNGKDVATPEVEEKNVATPAVPAVSEDKPAATTADANKTSSSLLPEMPKLPKLPTLEKRQLDDLMGSVPDLNEEDAAAPDVSQKNVTTPAVPAVSGDDVAATTTDAQNVTTGVVDNTAADASSTVNAKYEGVSKGMGKLDKVPVAVGLPIKRQLEDANEALPEVDEQDVTTPDVKQDNITAPATPVADEKHINSTATLNGTASAVNATGADASSTADAGFHNINKYMEKLTKLPIGGLPVKRDASNVVSMDHDDFEVASTHPTSGMPNYVPKSGSADAQRVAGFPVEPEHNAAAAPPALPEPHGPLYDHLVPLQHQQHQTPPEFAAAGPFDLPQDMHSAAPFGKRDMVSDTTEKVTSPDAGVEGVLDQVGPLA